MPETGRLLCVPVLLFVPGISHTFFVQHDHTPRAPPQHRTTVYGRDRLTTLCSLRLRTVLLRSHDSSRASVVSHVVCTWYVYRMSMYVSSALSGSGTELQTWSPLLERAPSGSLYTYHRPSQHSTTHALTNRSRRGHLALPAKPLEGTHARLERGR